MQKNKIQIPDLTNLKLKVGTEKEGSILSVNGLKLAKLKNSDLDLNCKKFETQEIDVVYKENSISYDGTILISFGSESVDVFNLKPVIDLKKDGDSYCFKIGDLKLRHDVKPEQIPNGLFDRRDSFKVTVCDSETINIIRFADLHLHSEYSKLDGISMVNKIAKKAEYSCAITDHGVMFGYLDFYEEMNKNDKHPIVGCEFYVERYSKDNKALADISNPDDLIAYKREHFKGEHLILLAKNNIGLNNLFKLTTKSYLNFRKRPHITYALLAEYGEGLIATSACIGGTLGKSIMRGEEEDGIEFLDKMLEIFGYDDFYIELQNHHRELFPNLEEFNTMKRIKEIAKEKGIKTTIGIDSHYLNEDDYNSHEYWLCQATKVQLSDEKRFRFIGGGYFMHSSDEVIALFPDDLDALDNTLEIADKCNISINFSGYHLPDFPLPEGFEKQEEYFRHSCREGFRARFKGTPAYKEEEYLERMKYELSIILKMGFPSYFLIVADFINFARDVNVGSNLEKYLPSNRYDHSEIPDFIKKKDYKIPVGPGRGSAAGSLVAYCMGITDVDPIKHGLLFERFLAVERISMPDIDVDFADDKRDIVIDYTKYKYGATSVSMIVTFGRAKAKKAVKIVAKIMGKPFSLGTKISKTIPEKPNMTLAKAYEESPEFKELYDNSDEVKSIIDIAKRIEGLVTNTSTHACGIVIAPSDVSDYIPQILIEKKTDGKTISSNWCTQIPMNKIEDMGLLKMDFLGLRTLSASQDTTRLVSKEYSVDIDFDQIPIDDIEIYRFLAKGVTDGVFQVESPYMKGLMQQLYQDLIKEQTDKDVEGVLQFTGEIGFSRLSDANALGRPGPMEEIPNYIQNMLDPSHTYYENDIMLKYLKPTYGIITYQEQLMSLVKELAGFSAAQADLIRKGMSKKKEEILTEYGDYFVNGSKKHNIDGCVARGMDKNVSEDLWEKMKKFGLYAFNKSHSVSYSMITARTAWLAHYYPVAFMGGVLNSFLSDAARIKGYMSVCKKRGISVLSPTVNKSDDKFSIEDSQIIFGLEGLKGMGLASKGIIAERKNGGDYINFADFVVRMATLSSFGKSAILSLIYSGALDIFEGTRMDKINSMDSVLNLIKDIKDRDRIGQLTLLDYINKDDRVLIVPPLKIDETGVEMKNQELLEFEDHYAGFYITAHPIDEYRELLKNSGTTEIAFVTAQAEDEKNATDERNEYDQVYNGKAKVAGIVKEFKSLLTREKSEEMFTFLIEDDSGSIKCVIFPKDAAKYKGKIGNGSMLVAQGYADADDFGTQLKVKDIVSIETLLTELKLVSLSLKLSDNVVMARGQYKDIKNLLAKASEGNTHVYLKREDQIYVFRDDDNFERLVNIDLKMLESIQAIVGEQNCRPLYN